MQPTSTIIIDRQMNAAFIMASPLDQQAAAAAAAAAASTAPTVQATAAIQMPDEDFEMVYDDELFMFHKINNSNKIRNKNKNTTICFVRYLILLLGVGLMVTLARNIRAHSSSILDDDKLELLLLEEEGEFSAVVGSASSSSGSIIHKDEIKITSTKEAPSSSTFSSLSMKSASSNFTKIEQHGQNIHQKQQQQQKQKQGSKVSTSSNNNSTATIVSDCSCNNSSATWDCCHRVLLVGHKFGSILISDMFKEIMEDTSKTLRSWGIQNVQALKDAATSDFRHVMLTRNLFDSIVSGYLYHKAGYECWLSVFGGPRTGGNRTDPWDRQVSFPNLIQPPRRERSICTYLAEESEEDGLRAYADWAMTHFYYGVIPYWNMAQQYKIVETATASTAVQTNNAGNDIKTLHVCYEDLTDPDQQTTIFEDMLFHLFPGCANDLDSITNTCRVVTAAITAEMTQQNSNSNNNIQQQQLKSYKGSHSTSHDPVLREHLLILLQRLDRDVFRNEIGRMQDFFRCGENKL